MEITWVRSSRSFANGNCVEVAAWRKSTRSNGHNECVEAGCGGNVVGVRDSKDPDGPVLRFTPAQWRAFLGGAAR